MHNGPTGRQIVAEKRWRPVAGGAGRQPIVAGNWKMNLTVAEGLALVDDLRRTIDSVSTVERVICPPFTSLYPIVERLRGSEIAVGAQNLYFQPSGAFTGEISAEMLAGLVRYVIVGHSERRHVLGETDEVVAKKLRAAVAVGLLPILCAGETLDERQAGQTEAVLRRQVRSALDGAGQVPGLVLAYEPVWAIGTGHAATAEDANYGCAIIRDEVARAIGDDVAQATRVQYGGSVTPSNAEELIAQPDVDGALVGGASLKAALFSVIVQAAA